MQTVNRLPEGWMPMAAFPPESCETYEALLSDGSILRAFWSGKAWWYQGKPVVPIGWRMPSAMAA